MAYAFLPRAIEESAYPRGFHAFNSIQQFRRIDCAPIYLTLTGDIDNSAWSHWFPSNVDRALRSDLLRRHGLTHRTESADKAAWPRHSHRWYKYTPASGLTDSTRVDPNVTLAFRTCPELKGGTFCLDPNYSARVVEKSVKHQQPPALIYRFNRKMRFIVNEQNGNHAPPITALTPHEVRIPPEWQPCYQMHRTQRILAADPCLSIIENFLLRMSIGQDQAIYLYENQINAALEAASLGNVQSPRPWLPRPHQ